MTVEANIENAGVYINALDDTYPAGGDDIVEGDNHVRGIKNTLLNTFANITGAVTSSHTELNNNDGMTSGQTMSYGDWYTVTVSESSVASGGSASPITITHGLGSDDVDFGASCIGSASLANGGALVYGAIQGTDKRTVSIGVPNNVDSATRAGFIATPSTGTLLVQLVNGGGVTQDLSAKIWVRLR